MDGVQQPLRERTATRGEHPAHLQVELLIKSLNYKYIESRHESNQSLLIQFENLS